MTKKKPRKVQFTLNSLGITTTRKRTHSVTTRNGEVFPFQTTSSKTRGLPRWLR